MYYYPTSYCERTGHLLGVCECCLYLQIEKLQAVQLVEEIMGESGQLATMHMQALQLLQAPEGSTFQVAQ